MVKRISYVVVGNGIAGITAVETLRAEDDSADIGVIADTPLPLYNRPMLKDFLAGRVSEDTLWMRPDSFYRDQLVHFVNGRVIDCLLYTSPSPRDGLLSRMPSSA